MLDGLLDVIRPVLDAVVVGYGQVLGPAHFSEVLLGVNLSADHVLDGLLVLSARSPPMRSL